MFFRKFKFSGSEKPFLLGLVFVAAGGVLYGGMQCAIFFEKELLGISKLGKSQI